MHTHGALHLPLYAWCALLCPSKNAPLHLAPRTLHLAPPDRRLGIRHRQRRGAVHFCVAPRAARVRARHVRAPPTPMPAAYHPIGYPLTRLHAAGYHPTPCTPPVLAPSTGARCSSYQVVAPSTLASPSRPWAGRMVSSPGTPQSTLAQPLALHTQDSPVPPHPFPPTPHRYAAANGIVVLKPCQGAPIDAARFPANHENLRGMAGAAGRLRPWSAALECGLGVRPRLGRAPRPTRLGGPCCGHVLLRTYVRTYYVRNRTRGLTYYAGRRVRPAVGGLRYAARRPDGTHRQDGQTHPQGGVTRWA